MAALVRLPGEPWGTPGTKGNGASARAGGPGGKRSSFLRAGPPAPRSPEKVGVLYRAPAGLGRGRRKKAARRLHRGPPGTASLLLLLLLLRLRLVVAALDAALGVVGH